MKISFDFDSTLSLKEVEDYASKLIKANYEVWVVTARFEFQNSSGHQINNDDLFEVTDRLEIPREHIHFCNMKDKFEYFKDYDNDFLWHLDDDIVELHGIRRHTLVMPIWRRNGNDWYNQCEDFIRIINAKFNCDEKGNNIMDNKKTKKYQIEFTEKQLRTVAEACEFMSRFTAGQTEHLPFSFTNWLWTKYPNIKEFCNRRDVWEYNLKLIKTYMFDSEEYGIGDPTLLPESNICYDIYRPILEQFAKEYNEAKPEDYHYSVYNHEGLTTSKEGRIKITKI